MNSLLVATPIFCSREYKAAVASFFFFFFFRSDTDLGSYKWFIEALTPLVSFPPMEPEPPICYGDLRLQTERRSGTCLFWVRLLRLHIRRCRGNCLTHCPRPPQVVPDVAAGFNVPDFYAKTFGTPLVNGVQREQREEVAPGGPSPPHDERRWQGNA